jgi:hypothetical protein
VTTETILYRVLWGALGEPERAELELVADGIARPSHDLTVRIREAEQSLEIGGLPVGEAPTAQPEQESPRIDPQFLAWVRSRG